MVLSASANVDRKSIRSRPGFTIVWIASDTPSFLPELVGQLLQLGLMLLGLELFATLFCLLAKPVLEILVGLLLLFRGDVASRHTIESETAATCRDGLEIPGGSGMALQGPAQRRFVDVGMRRSNGLVNADSQRLDIPKYGVGRDQASKDRVAGRRAARHGMNYARWNMLCLPLCNFLLRLVRDHVGPRLRCLAVR